MTGKPALHDQTEFGKQVSSYDTFPQFKEGFGSFRNAMPLGDVDGNPTQNLYVSLTQNGQHQFGSYTFLRAIDMTHDFQFSGWLSIQQPGDTLGDSLGFILAPLEKGKTPDNIQNGSTGGYLGIGKEPEDSTKGFANAYFWGADLHYNPRASEVDKHPNPDHKFDGNTEFGDPDIMQKNPDKNYVMFRQTNKNGNLVPMRDSTPDNDPGMINDVNLNTQGDNYVTLSWNPSGTNDDGSVKGALTATGWGKTWSEEIDRAAANMSFSDIAATGGDTSYMSLEPKNFKLTTSTSDV
ncbi:lectin-like domain-containing protein [Weissella confusa]|uniref:lectin-like domain-containing protein n=1 Tax=Weissella confusa TaxID=1583 RepID=UPI0022E142A3|nr:hypothetical protein [Weissella confusa]